MILTYLKLVFLIRLVLSLQNLVKKNIFLLILTNSNLLLIKHLTYNMSLWIIILKKLFSGIIFEVISAQSS